MTEQDYNQRKAREDWSSESLRAMVVFATITLRSLILVNGGAVVVFMALLGSLWGGDENSGRDLALALVWPFRFFIGGLITAVLAASFSYWDQVLVTENIGHKKRIRWSIRVKLSTRFRWAATLFVAASVSFFTAGAFTALSAFS